MTGGWLFCGLLHCLRLHVACSDLFLLRSRTIPSLAPTETTKVSRATGSLGQVTSKVGFRSEIAMSGWWCGKRMKTCVMLCLCSTPAHFLIHWGTSPLQRTSAMADICKCGTERPIPCCHAIILFNITEQKLEMQLENLVCSCASLDRFTNSRIPVVFQANHLVQEMLSINRSRPLRRIGVEIRQSKRPAQLAVLGAALAALAIAAWVLELEGEESFNKNRYVTMFVCIPCRKKPVSGWSMAVWHFDIMVARLPSAPASCWRVFRHQGMFSSFSLGTKWDFTRSSPSTFVSRKAWHLRKNGEKSYLGEFLHLFTWLDGWFWWIFFPDSWMLFILWVSANPRG